jgi:hypothetical protein
MQQVNGVEGYIIFELWKALQLNMHTHFTEQAVHTPVQANKGVFLHVLAHTRELNLYRDANLLMNIPPANTRKLEDL